MSAELAATPAAMPWDRTRAAAFLVAPTAESDKYRRGVLGVRTGSSAYPGAAVLGVEAAWRTGIGLVRYAPPLDDPAPRHGLPSPAAAVLAARPETVFVDGASRAHCDAWLLGSGTDPAERSFAERQTLQSLIGGDAPLIVDAGALPEVSSATRLAPIVLTPHRGEFLALWREAGFGERPADWPADRDCAPAEAALTAAAARLTAHLGVTVLLKGSRSIAASPGGRCAVAGPATPWLATAGTGDVLAGVLGTLVATHGAAVRADPELLAPLAATAALLHDTAARLASGDAEATGAGRPITALDVAHALPDAVARLASST